MSIKKSKNKKIRHNQQFLKNETSIFITILKRHKRQRGRITVQQIAKDTGLARQTFYEHHHNINQAIRVGETSLIKDFKEYLSENMLVANADSNRRLITVCFLFISQHKEVFCHICADSANQGIIYQILSVLYPKLQIKWLPANMPPPAMDSEPVDRFLRLAVGIICRWGKSEHCDFKKADRYIEQFIRLATNVSQIVRL